MVLCWWLPALVAERPALHRIAHLIGEHGVDPAQILAVTFANKAAREMKEKRAALGQKLAQSQYAQPGHPVCGGAASVTFTHPREVTKELWIGTFHALFARMLRYDIIKFNNSEGLAQFA